MSDESIDSSVNDEGSSPNEIDVLKRELEQEKKRSDAFWDTIKTLRMQKTVEYRVGTFEQRITRHGKKRKQRTARKGRSEHKLTLAWIGNAELFCYPYNSFDKIFMRVENKVTTIDKYILPSLFRAYNKGKWFMEHGKSVVKGGNDSQSPLATEILLAYVAGQQKETITTKTLQARIDKEKELELFEYMYGVKEKVRLKWLNEEPHLVNRYRKFSKKKDNELSIGSDKNE